MPLVKFLAGAPLLEELDRAQGKLSDEFLPAFARFLGDNGPSTVDGLSSIPASTRTVAGPRWREVAVNSRLLYGTPDARSVAPADDEDLSPELLSNEDRDDFLAQSLAVLDNLDSSQIAPHPGKGAVEDEETTFLTTTSFSGVSDTYDASPSQKGGPKAHAQTIAITGPVTGLRHIPSAAQLIRSRPQTITVNLLVAVISVSPVRTVTVKRGQYDMEIIELLLGDETRAGFSITAWLSPTSNANQGRGLQSIQSDTMREELAELRTGDVVFVQNVALSVFRDQVFGQTLNRRTTRNATRFLVIRDANLSPRVNSTLSTAIATKFEKVVEWTDHFIGPSRKRRHDGEAARKGKRIAVEPESSELPPDTP